MNETKDKVKLLYEEINELKKELILQKQQTKMAGDTIKDFNQILFDTSNDFLAILDSKGNFISFNTIWTNKLGYLTHELENKNILQVMDSENIDSTKLQFLEQVGNKKFFQTTLNKRNGKKIYVKGKISPFEDIDKKRKFYCSFIDTTEKYSVEMVQQLFTKITTQQYASDKIEVFYQNIYEILKNILNVDNFCIIQKKGVGTQLEFKKWEKAQNSLSNTLEKSLIAYTQEINSPVMIYKSFIQKLIHENHSLTNEKLPEIWLGVNINIDNKFSILLSVYSFENANIYSNRDLELLELVSNQISLINERNSKIDTIESQEARLNSIINSSSHLIWSVDKNFNYTFFNENYLKYFKKEFNVDLELGMNLKNIQSHFLQSEEIKLWIEKYNLALNGEQIYFEYQKINRWNKKVWWEIYLNPILLHNQKIEEVSVIANDITYKKEASIALQNSEEKFRNIFESFQDIYFRCTLSGKITMISPSIKNVLDLDIEDVEQKNIVNFISKNSSPLSILKRLITFQQIRNHEVKVLNNKKKEIPMLCNIRLKYQNKKPYEIEGVAKDISEIKKVNDELSKAKEVALHSLKVKEQFLANMSHEIRTPMNGIIGMIDLLQSTKLSFEQEEYLNTVKNSSEILLDIVNSILNLSKIEAGKMKPKKQPVHLVSTIEKIYDLFSQQAHKAGNSLYYYIDSKLPNWVLTDETQIIQILSNLTSNAIKFSESNGTIDLSITVIKKVKNNYTFKISVKDSGIGIEEKDQIKLFENFHQLDSSESKLYEGTGLGLSISKQLVEGLKGNINVVSTKGFGSTFWFTFTAKSCKPPTQISEIKKENIEPISTKPKILIVDDNKINRIVAQKILSKSGCTTYEADSGMRAIDLIKKKRFDLIFMDIQMPDMHGIQTREEIKKLNIELPGIIAMTAYSMEEDRKKFLNYGFDDYLSKPIKAENIIGMVQKWIRFTPEKIKLENQKETEDKLIINQNTLNQLRKFGGKQLVKESLDNFLDESSHIFQLCEEYVETKNYKGLQDEIHNLKGSSSTIGAEIIAETCLKMESRLKDSKFEEIEEILNLLGSNLDLFKENYKNIIKSYEK